MPAYYFSIEGMKTGEKSDPATDRLVTLMYQKIDLTTGEPLDLPVILRVWDSSEQEIVTLFYTNFFRPGTPVTQFIPVGLNLDYAYEMLLALFRKYGLAAPASHELWYQRPRFDLRPVIVLLNNGRFAGANLDAFTMKKGEDRHMEKWYDKKEFGRIEHYVREEASRFLKVLQYLSKYKTRLGITVREARTPKRNPYTPAPAERPAPAPALPPKVPVQPARPVQKAAATVKPALRDRSVTPAAKAAAHTLLPAKERTAAERKRTPPGPEPAGQTSVGEERSRKEGSGQTPVSGNPFSAIITGKSGFLPEFPEIPAGSLIIYQYGEGKPAECVDPVMVGETPPRYRFSIASSRFSIRATDCRVISRIPMIAAQTIHCETAMPTSAMRAAATIASSSVSFSERVVWVSK